MELFANNADTTLNGGISNSATSLIVASSSLFPPTGNFRVLIGSEVLLVTGVSGNTWTVTRGIESTTAVAHSNGERIDHIITEGALLKLKEDVIVTDTYANRPVNSVKGIGRLFLPTDSLYLQRDTGSAWASFGPIWPIFPPDLTSFTWINQGDASVINDKGYIFMRAPKSATDNIRIQKKSIPSSPYTITLGFVPGFIPLNSLHVGLVLRESGSSKLITFTLQYNNGYTLGVYGWTNPTAFNTSYLQIPFYYPQWLFMRIVDDNTLIHYQISTDGFNFIEAFSHSRTAFLTANECGFYIDPINPNYDVGVTIFGWVESNP